MQYADHDIDQRGLDELDGMETSVSPEVIPDRVSRRYRTGQIPMTPSGSEVLDDHHFPVSSKRLWIPLIPTSPPVSIAPLFKKGLFHTSPHPPSPGSSGGFAWLSPPGVRTILTREEPNSGTKCSILWEAARKPEPVCQPVERIVS